MPVPADPWRSATCEGERCGVCDRPAPAKVAEEIAPDDPMPDRHPLTAYVRAPCFTAIMGRAGMALVNRMREGADA